MSWKITLGWAPADSDAAAYISAVEAADTAAGQAGGLEQPVKIAIDNFVIGCKQDGIWSAIKSSCILAGARTLDGALVPLVGAAPTNYNFVAGDYNRETGLKGDGSTKYVDSNRNNNADPQNSNHNAIFVTEASAGGRRQIAAGSSQTGSNNILNLNPYLSRNRSSTAGYHSSEGGLSTGLIGTSRDNSSSYTFRVAGIDTVCSVSSQVPLNTNVTVYQGDGSFYSDARLVFYSIGEALDLQKLDARVTDLMTAIGAAIP